MSLVAVRSGRLRRGFSLVEICVVLALTGIVATLAWPSFQSQLQRGRRADGVAALLRVQMAQESYRAHHGLYATQLAALRGASASHSAQGLYDIEMAGDGITRYEALARARPGSPVALDRDCAVLRLHVRDGQAEFAPSRQCWNR